MKGKAIDNLDLGGLLGQVEQFGTQVDVTPEMQRQAALTALDHCREEDGQPLAHELIGYLQALGLAE